MMSRLRRTSLLLAVGLLASLLLACEPAPEDAPPSDASAGIASARTTPAVPTVPIAVGDRLASIPTDATKVTPETDALPPILQLAGYQQPVPFPGPVTSAGAEDSPFISPDGTEFFYFFTPSARIPAERQLTDTVTGIWTSHLTTDGEWSEPSRVVLHDDLSLDGCETLHDDLLWFCSVRAGNLREIDIYTADRPSTASDPGSPVVWQNVTNVGEHLNLDIVLGELHVTADGREIYFHRPALDDEEGYGGVDLWVTRLVDDIWQPAENLGPRINTVGDDLLPFVTSDGSELWFTSASRLGYQGPSVFRSRRLPDGSWDWPVEAVSQFAAEPTLDDAGNLYFAHHFYADDGTPMIEADIYVAYRIPE